MIGWLLFAERHWPRRARTQPEPERTLRNATLGVMSLAVVALMQRPLAQPLARHVAERGKGLAQNIPAPPWLRDVAAFLALDYTMYLWHIATHRVAWLWRLHLVHHIDLDMDASTALRFHAVDMAVSVPLRLLQIRVLGAGPRALAVWEGWFFTSVLFHHSNLRLSFDDALAHVLTTPGMHDIHHRADFAAQDRNFSSGLSVWDWWHGTIALRAVDAPLGVPGRGDAASQGLWRALALPFEAGRVEAGIVEAGIVEAGIVEAGPNSA